MFVWPKCVWLKSVSILSVLVFGQIVGMCVPKYRQSVWLLCVCVWPKCMCVPNVSVCGPIVCMIRVYV